MNFFIFRHGITYVSKHDLEYGASEETASILKEAEPSLERMGKYLKEIGTDINLTSPYKRCLETVDIVSRFSEKEFAIDERLGEYRTDLEDIPKFIQRVKDFVDELKRRNYENVLICSHGYPISAMLLYLKGEEISIEKLNVYPKTGVLSVFKDGKLSEIDFNKTT